MVGSSEGRPYCVRGGRFLNREAIKNSQCEICLQIRWIGCPGFNARNMAADGEVSKYITDFEIAQKTLKDDYQINKMRK